MKPTKEISQFEWEGYLLLNNSTYGNGVNSISTHISFDDYLKFIKKK